MKGYFIFMLTILVGCSQETTPIDCGELSPQFLFSEIRENLDPISDLSDDVLTMSDYSEALFVLSNIKSMSDECQSPPEDFSTLGLTDEEIDRFIEDRSDYVDISVQLSWILLDFDYLSSNEVSAQYESVNWREKYAEFIEEGI